MAVIASGVTNAALRNNELMIRLLRYIIVPLNPGFHPWNLGYREHARMGLSGLFNLAHIQHFDVEFPPSWIAIQRGSRAFDFKTGAASGDVMYLIRALPASALFVFDATPAPKLM